MTLAGIRTAVRDLIDSPSNDDFLSDTLLNRMINNSYKLLVTKIQRRYAEFYMKQSTITMVASTYLYDLPTDVVNVHDIYNSDGDSLRQGNKGEFSVVDNDGDPCYYDFFGEHVWLNPVPDAAGTLSINYYYMPADLASNNESPDLPFADMAQLIAIDVAIKCKVRDEAGANALKQMYAETEREMLSLIQTRGLNETRRVKGGFDNSGATDV